MLFRSHDPGMYPKRLVLDEARQMGIAILPVDVNKSGANYLVELVEDNGIRLALSDLSGISADEVSNIVRAQPYLDLTDFVRRAGASLPTTEKLIMIGAFDGLHNINRRELLLHLSDINRSPAAALPGAQMTFGFKAPDLKPSGLPDLSNTEKVRNEVEYLGMEVSSHLMQIGRAHV